jgi:hypothetical protein
MDSLSPQGIALPRLESPTALWRTPIVPDATLGRSIQTTAPSSSNDCVDPNAKKPSPTGVIGFRATFSLVAIFLFLGLVGHAPWKQDETYVFGIIYHFLNSNLSATL